MYFTVKHINGERTDRQGQQHPLRGLVRVSGRLQQGGVTAPQNAATNTALASAGRAPKTRHVLGGPNTAAFTGDQPNKLKSMSGISHLRSSRHLCFFKSARFFFFVSFYCSFMAAG